MPDDIKENVTEVKVDEVNVVAPIPEKKEEETSIVNPVTGEMIGVVEKAEKDTSLSQPEPKIIGQVIITLFESNGFAIDGKGVIRNNFDLIDTLLMALKEAVDRMMGKK